MLAGVCVTWPHSRGNDREFVGSELSFLKLVSALVGLSGGMLNFSSKPAQPK